MKLKKLFDITRNPAYALRTSRIIGKNPASFTGKPDGMFIRKEDGLFTDHKPNALVFDKAYDAEDFLKSWKQLHPEFQDYPFFLIQVEVEPVVQRQIAVLKQL